MQHFTQDELKRLIKEIPKDRQKLMIAVGFSHGLRVSELTTLTKENIRDGHVVCQRLKGSLKTVQPFVEHPDPELNEAGRLRVLYGTLKPNERLFPMTRSGVWRLIQRAGERAGLPKHKLHPHALKHSCAMVAIKTAGIQNIRQYLGHKSIASTGEYLKVSDSEASKAFIGSL